MTLRTRLLLGLVALAAVGLTVAGAVTYRQTRSDLVSRVNHQLTSASQSPQLFFPSFGSRDEEASTALLPPGTWAQARAAGTGEILGTNKGSLNENSPVLPAQLTPGTTFTVRSPHYRVRVASPSPFIIRSQFAPPQTVQASLIVAIPLADVDHTLHHLFLVEVVVILGVLLAIALLAWWVVKLGLRPLEHM